MPRAQPAGSSRRRRGAASRSRRRHPPGGAAIQATGAVSVAGDLAVTGVISGSGAGLSALNASNLATGTVDPARLPGTAPLLNRRNAFQRGSSFQGRVRFAGGLSSKSAGKIRVPAGVREHDVSLPAGVRLTVNGAIVLTPREDPGDVRIFAGRLAPDRFRIRFSAPTSRAVTVYYAVFS